MVLYTPLDYHDVFQDHSTNYAWMRYRGRLIQSIENEDGQKQVIQLVSSDPADFLNTAFSPGTLLPKEDIPNQS